MKLHDLLERAQEDFSRVQDGAKLFHAIQSYVYKTITEGGKAFFVNTYEQDGKTYTYLTLPLVRMEYDAEYRDLVLVLWDRDTKWGGHFYSEWKWGQRDGATKAIVLYTKEINTPFRALQDKSSIFVHEYIHYLDDKKIKGGIGKGRKPYQHPEHTTEYMDEYYNNPVEYNAHFLQGAREMIMMCDRTIRLRNSVPKDFKEFLYTFTLENGFFGGEFRTLMKGKWRKKFISRMQKLHEFMLERYASGNKPADALY